MLTRQELRAIRLLSTGATTAYIAAALEVTPGRVHALYVWIRDKTGIKDIFDKKQVQDFMESCKPARAKKPTTMQAECMRLFIDDWSYEEIAAKLRLSNTQTAQNHVSLGCKRLGIIQEHHAEYLDTFRVSWRWRRRELIENYLNGWGDWDKRNQQPPRIKSAQQPQTPTPATEPDPMSDPAFN